MALLHFHYGAMGSSKSANLITNAFNFKKNGIKIEVIKPDFDKRFSDDKIVSRLGIEWPAAAMPELINYRPSTNTKVILVDEVQFFSPEDINKLVRINYEDSIIVMCYGLMTDSNQEMFPAAKRLIEVGAELHQMKSSCEINGCMKPANHNLRFDDKGNVVRKGKQFELGAEDKYKGVCQDHFYKKYYNSKDGI